MVFSSVIFLFLFFPVVLAVYHLLFLSARSGGGGGRWLANLWLMMASLLFYAWAEPLFILVMLFSTVVDYGCGLAMAGGFRPGPVRRLEPGGPRSRGQKRALLLSLGLNLGLLGFFKYFNFAVDSVNGVGSPLGLPWIDWEFARHVILPLGISFYTFQTMTYTIDVYRGKGTATQNFSDFACYVTMFPQLVAGPIVRYAEMEQQLKARRITSEAFASGIQRFVLGLGKKVLIANTLAVMVDRIYAMPGSDLTASLAWLAAVGYTLQLYFDFSGYADMAIGLGLMLGFRFPENFDYPYVARSIREFWRRWHMTLTRWFRDYLYIPLGGNRLSNRRTYLNLVIVFFLCGLWHGAHWTFVIWGLFQGLFLILERAAGPGRFGRRRWIPLRHLYTLGLLGVSFVLIRATSLSQAMAVYRAMAGLGAGDGGTLAVETLLSLDVLLAGGAGILFSMPVYRWVAAWAERWRPSGLAESVRSVGLLVGLAAIFALSAMSIVAGGHNPFIYFRF